MKHLPIILTPHKIKAILSQQATQVRIPLNPQPAEHLTAFYPPSQFRRGFEFYVYTQPGDITRPLRKYPEMHCPYGKRGDFLYVQEDWSTIGVTSQDYILRATTPDGLFTDRNKNKEWQPANTMPKWIARIWLRVTDVAIQRLSSLSIADAMAEGPTPKPQYNVEGCLPAYHDYLLNSEESFVLGPRIAFRRDFINSYGQDLCDADPWLWAITFKLTNSPLERK